MTEGITVSDLQTYYFEAAGVSLYEPFVTIAVGETPYEAVSRLVDNSGFNPSVGYLVSKVMSHNHKVCVVVSGTFRRLFTVGQNVYTDNLNSFKSYLNADGSFDEEKFHTSHSVDCEKQEPSSIEYDVTPPVTDRVAPELLNNVGIQQEITRSVEEFRASVPNLFTDNGVTVTTEAVGLGLDGQQINMPVPGQDSVTVETETVAVGLDGQQMSMPRGMTGSVYHVDEDTSGVLNVGNRTFGRG